MRGADAIFPVGVWYAGPAVRREFHVIRTLGFNAVWLPEPDPEVITQARAAGLDVIGHLDRVGELHAGPSATARDLRVWGWTAMLRGARAIAYCSWRDLADEHGVPNARGRAAGEFAGVVSRNPALFVPLRPRAAATGEADVRVSGVPGQIEAGFLESRDALLLIAVNHASSPQEATLTFAPGTKQEFWQNMETGEMVSFAMPQGRAVLVHRFDARDALVLMIRTRSPYDQG